MAKPAWINRWGLHLRKGSAAFKWAAGRFGKRKTAPAPKPAPAGPVAGCDYVSGPTISQLKKAGIKFVFRYLSTPGNPKNLSHGEAKALLAAGIKVGLVFETTGTTFKGGSVAGKHDATMALQQVKALGVPDTVPIYFAVDEDPHGHEHEIVAYIRAASAVLGRDRTGVYGGLTAIEACHAANACSWFWQTLAWSGYPTQWHPASHVRQHTNGAHIGGHNVDLDSAVKVPYGVWG